MEIYICNIDTWDALSGIEFLNAERRRKVERYIKQKDKVRALVGGLMLNYALGHNNQPLYNDYGKPFFENDLQFNISHSGNFVALAVSTQAIGIDVERVKPFSMDVAKKCFTHEELLWLEKHNTPQAFCKIWSAKESIMKATGFGFTLSPTNIQVLPICDGPHIIDTNRWFLYWHSLEDHELCVASANITQKKPIITLSMKEILDKLDITL